MAAYNGTDGNDSYTGTNGDDVISGGGGDDQLRGAGGADQIEGGAGNDTLDGGAGDDSMSGGTGNDSYRVDSEGDQVIEAAGEGTDTILSRVSYALSADSFVEYLRVFGATTTNVVNLTGNAHAQTVSGNAAGNLLMGEGGDDVVIGYAGNDTLDGGTGNDSLYGGVGDDSYRVDSVYDRVIEAAGEGTDTVLSTVSYALTAGSAIEELRVLGATTTNVVNLTGSNYAQTVAGNAANNLLKGEGGNDTLIGYVGNDTLDGGTGSDSMYGGVGDDSYRVDGTGDQVFETAGEGSDTVLSTVSYTLTSGSAVEYLRVFGATTTNVVNLTGNAHAQTVAGNAANNLLKGEGGDDTLIGYAGNDTLDGGTGNDAMQGGAGDDSYRVDSASDQVIEVSGQGTDAVLSTASYTLAASAAVEDLRVFGATTTNIVDLTGNGFAQTIAGNAAANSLHGEGGNDTLLGNAGDDSLRGGQGDDLHYGGEGNDLLSESSGDTGPFGNDLYDGGAGSDRVSYFLTYGPGVTVNLNTTVTQNTGQGSDRLIGIEHVTGAYGNNVLTGTNADNWFWTFQGNDTLSGNGGNDYFTVGTGDKVVDGGTGTDTLELADFAFEPVYNPALGFTVSLALQGTAQATNVGSWTISNVENLGGWTGNDHLTGDDNANVIVGQIGDDVLVGAGGDDMLAGDATWIFENGAQVLVLDNTDGPGGNDVLEGGAGNDTLNGGGGADRFVFADLGGSDTIIDYLSGTDVIDMAALDANSSLSGDQAFNWVGANAFSNVAGELRTYSESGTNYLAGDVNGDGAADFLINLGSSAVISTDFML